MALLYTPGSDPSRVYYGTDTRAAGILIGAALACGWRPWRSLRAAAPGAGALFDGLGFAGLGVLALCGLLLSDSSTFLYRGGFAVVSVASALVIAAAVHPAAARLPRMLGRPTLKWIGLRSYGIYLWHWPIFIVLAPGTAGLDGPLLLAARFGLTFVVAALSYRFVETPIRRDGLGVLRRWRAGSSAGEGWLSAPILGAVTAVSVLTVAVASASSASPFVDTRPDAAAGSAPSTAPLARAGDGLQRITIVGDSVGMTLLRNAPPELAQAFTVTDGSIEGCGIVDGKVKTAAKGFSWNFGTCADWPSRWAAKVSANQAQLALVSVGAWDVFDLERDGHLLVFGTPESDQYLLAQLQRGIDAVKAVGAKVALLEVPCYRPVSAGGLTALPERGQDDRTRHLNTLLRAAAASDPGHVSFLPGVSSFCTDESVSTDRGNRWDGVHYYKPGAKLVWDTLIPELQALRV